MPIYTRPMTYPEYQELERTAQASFIQFIDIVNHVEDMPFADKQAMVAAYKECYELFSHNCAMLESALDRINPAYQGMTEFRTCGERFYVKQGEWHDVEIGAMLRHDSYLHVSTQETHTLEYTFHQGFGVVKLDGAIVWGTALGQAVNSFNDLPKEGANQLLIKIGVLF